MEQAELRKILDAHAACAEVEAALRAERDAARAEVERREEAAFRAGWRCGSRFSLVGYNATECANDLAAYRQQRAAAGEAGT